MSLGKIFKKVAKVGVVAASAYFTGGASLAAPGFGVSSLASSKSSKLPGAGFLQPYSYPTANAGGYGMTVSNKSGLPSLKGPPLGLTKEIFEAGAKLMTRLGLTYTANISSYAHTLKKALAAIGALARRTPAGTIVSLLTGLGLTMYEATSLVSWHATRRRYRRMNPANSKALRRAARRIKSFHKLCMHTDVIKTRGRRSVGRCNTCSKNPCRC